MRSSLRFVNKTSIELFLVALAAALIWCMRWALWGVHPPHSDGDTYLEMAAGKDVGPPWVFHLLTPRLAGLLSRANPSAGFFLIAAGSFVGTALTINVLLRRAVGADAVERTFGVGLFMATCTGVFMFRFYFLTDALSYFLLAVACAATLYGRDRVTSIVTLAGIFNRETALFVIPVWLYTNAGVSRVALLRRFALTFAPAAIGYFLLHHTSLALGHEPRHLNYLVPENALKLWAYTLSWLGTNNIFYGLAVCMFLAYGPAWLLAGIGLAAKRTPRFLYALWTLSIPVALTLVLVDWVRGFQPIFPAVVASAVLGARAMTAKTPRYCLYLLLISTVLACAVTTEAWWFPPMRWPVGIAMSLWACVVVLVWLQTRHSTPRGMAGKHFGGCGTN